MNTTDLLKMCDDVLELSEKATKGPWTKKGDYVPEVYCGCCSSSEDDARFIVSSRTALPILASALKGLLPYVRHEYYCGALQATQIGDENGVEIVYEPCTCGLDSTLSALEGQASRG